MTGRGARARRRGRQTAAQRRAPERRARSHIPRRPRARDATACRRGSRWPVREASQPAPGSRAQARSARIRARGRAGSAATRPGGRRRRARRAARRRAGRQRRRGVTGSRGSWITFSRRSPPAARARQALPSQPSAVAPGQALPSDDKRRRSHDKSLASNGAAPRQPTLGPVGSDRPSHFRHVGLTTETRS